MNTTNNTVLITGGSAGIGFEIAALFSEKGNQVIITGRDEQRLKAAAARLKNTTAIVSDVSDPAQVDALVERVNREFPQLNVLVNNAGKAYYYGSAKPADVAGKAAEEMLTNYTAVISLTEKLQPLLEKQKSAAVVNVTSIVAFAPGARLATYAASKAALHSYTQSLRHTLAKTTNIKVFELMPPLVNTEFSKEIGGENGIPARQVADDLLTAIANDHYQIHVGNTENLYQLSLSSPAEAFKAMNSAE
jgi:uncharacterized oxidoreductase